MSSSSSEDDDEQKAKMIREAVSEELNTFMKGGILTSMTFGSYRCLPVHTDRNFSSENPQAVRKAEKKGSNLLREIKNNDKSKESDLKITPEFRKHVATKLEAYLDSLIDSSSGLQVPTQHHSAEDSGGIKLLSSSNSLLKEAKDSTVRRKKERKVSSSDSSSDEEMKKLASVCVTGESVLQNGEGAFKRKLISTTDGAKKSKQNSSKYSKAGVPKKKKKKASDINAVT